MKKISLLILLLIYKINSTNYLKEPELEEKKEKVETKKIKDKKIEKIVNIKEFNSKVLTQKFSIVKFGANWCGPCQRLKPTLENINKVYSQLKIFDINVDESSELSNNYKIRNIPVLIFFKDGKQVAKKVGALSEKDIKVDIKKYFDL